MQKRLKIKCNSKLIDYKPILIVFFHKKQNKTKYYRNVLRIETDIGKRSRMFVTQKIKWRKRKIIKIV